MGMRRFISLLLLITFAVTAATGILFFPYIRLIFGLNDEGFWRYVHFLSTSMFFVFIIIHILINRKALGNYLRSARIFSITAFILAIILFAGILYQGIIGTELGLTGPIYEEDVRRIREAQEPVLITFPEDFKDGDSDGWSLGSGWKVEADNRNYNLTCSSDNWSSAIPKAGDGWFNYTLETTAKVINGDFQLNFRTSERPFRSRYILGFNDTDYNLSREINGNYTHLGGNKITFTELNEWHKFKVVLKGTSINIYIDNELIMDYTDIDSPLIFGAFSYSVGPNSHVLFDDINVIVP